MVNSDWTEQPPYIPIKALSEKSAELAPEAVASLKVNGMRGQDLVLKAVVNSEDELVIPDENILAYPIIQPINRTVHELYPGSLAAATLNLYSFVSGKLPGFSASTGTVIFKADAERFGGGIAVDEDEIFAD